jgi:hypothetical protein
MMRELSKTWRRLSDIRLRIKFFLLTIASRILCTVRYLNFRPVYDGNAVIYGIEGNVSSLARYLNNGQTEKFLKRIAELVLKLMAAPLMGRALFIPALDELTRNASLAGRPRIDLPTDSNILVHVATEVSSTGGHTRVIEDVVAALPEYRHILIITALNSLEAFPSLRPRFDELGIDVRPLQSLGRAQKVRELSCMIDGLAPRAVFLFVHHYDAIAALGVAGHAAPRVLFMHHADHQPSLGASRTDYVHIDLTPACHRVCSRRPQLAASLINLTAADVGTVQLGEHRPIIGATCGSPHKYEGSSDFSYAELLAALFDSGVGQILHIGEVPARQKDQIRAEIAANGQESSRLIFLPNTPSLAVKLIEVCPDFYLTSHPVGGGRSTVEAMSVGLPILYVCAASTAPLLNADMTFATSVRLSTLGETRAAVRRLESERKSLGKRSRAVYENHYSRAAFREALLCALSNESTGIGDVQQRQNRLMQI